ncbi:MAG: hypothetical protein ACLPYS_05730 [Vulcanimicrobiaceae bacterium]
MRQPPQRASWPAASHPARKLYDAAGSSVIDGYAPPFTSASTPLFGIPTVNAVNAMTFGL